MSEEEIPLPDDIAADLVERVKLWKSLDASQAAGQKIQGLAGLASAAGTGVPRLDAGPVFADVPTQIGQTLIEAESQAEIVTKAQAELAANQKQIADMERSRRQTTTLLIVLAAVIVLCLIFAASSGMLGGRR